MLCRDPVCTDHWDHCVPVCCGHYCWLCLPQKVSVLEKGTACGIDIKYFNHLAGKAEQRFFIKKDNVAHLLYAFDQNDKLFPFV